MKIHRDEEPEQLSAQEQPAQTGEYAPDGDGAGGNAEADGDDEYDDEDDEDEEADEEEQDGKRKKKLPLWAKILLGILLVLLLLVLLLYILVQGLLGKINRAESVSETPQQEETFETDEEVDPNAVYLDPDEVVWDGADTSVMKDKDVVNLLLIGQDRREGEGRQRSDSMIMVTLNKKTKQISLTSFMRDLYVQIPGYSDNRINASYAFGGMELLDSTLSTNFGVEIAGNVEVDFSGFQALIDNIGGIDLELTQAEADYIRQGHEDVWDLTEGWNHLNGEQALAHARNRTIGNDYARTDRQRAVILAVIHRMSSRSPSAIISFINTALPMLTTDMTSGEILGYVMEGMQMDYTDISSYRVPVEGSYTGAVIRGMQVLVPDLTANRQFLKENLYNGTDSAAADSTVSGETQ